MVWLGMVLHDRRGSGIGEMPRHPHDRAPDNRTATALQPLLAGDSQIDRRAGRAQRDQLDSGHHERGRFGREFQLACDAMISTYINEKARKGHASGIAGRGLHAVESIAAGEVVAVKGGHIVTTQTLRTLPHPLPNSEVQIADGLHLVALTQAEYEPVMLFINHSCEPNVGFGGNTVLVAMRDVAVGEELTTDYAMFDDYDGEMGCTCGTPRCRRVIDGHDWQLPELQTRYRGYFSWYLQRKIDGQPTHGR